MFWVLVVVLFLLAVKVKDWPLLRVVLVLLARVLLLVLMMDACA